MDIATWNLNHRVGKTRYQSDAPFAAAELGADIIVLTEYFPEQHEQEFGAALADKGYPHQFVSADPSGSANRVLIASRVGCEPYHLKLPTSDVHMPANVLAVRTSGQGIVVIGVRIPAYSGTDRGRTAEAWDWLETLAASLLDNPALIIGDLNVAQGAEGAGKHLERLLAQGWRRASPTGSGSDFGSKGYSSEIDHLLTTPACHVKDARYVSNVPGFSLAGSESALSDHAALVATVRLMGGEG